METKSNKIIHVGLLAFGMSGRIFHAPFLTLAHGFNLRAVTERNEKKAKLYYPDIISYNNIDELLDDDNIELVVINTPNNLHYEHSKLALQKHKHILVEKPFTATAAQAKELFELADQMGRQIFFYQNRRWDSDFISVKKIIDGKQLGKLVEVHFRFDRYRNSISPKAFKENPIEASGLLYDLGPHLLDQVISLFGKPLSHYKVLGKNREGTLVDDYFFIHLNYENDLNVFLTANMLVASPQAAFVLHGTKGSFIKQRADVQEEQLVAEIKPAAAEYGIENKDKAGLLSIVTEAGMVKNQLITAEKGNYQPLFDAVYQAIIHKRPYPISRKDIIVQLEILEGE